MKRLCIFAVFVFSCAISLAAQNSWTPIYDGKTTDGWQHVGPGGFTVENGLLETHGGMGLLWYTKRKFGSGDTIRVVFQTTAKTSNSGVYIRFPDRPKDAWYPVHFGYEVQIDGAGDDWHCTGAIYSLSRALKRMQKPPGEWNTMEITFDGPKTHVVLNGVTVNDFDMNSPVPPREKWFEPERGPRALLGYIGLQNHDTGSTVRYKEVSFRGK